MKGLLEKILPTLIVALVIGSLGYAIRFELLASEVGDIKKQEIKIVKKQNLIAWLLCEDKIKEGKDDEAIKRCKKVLSEEKEES